MHVISKVKSLSSCDDYLADGVCPRPYYSIEIFLIDTVNCYPRYHHHNIEKDLVMSC